MYTVKITLESGDYIITRIKGTESKIRAYYAIGSTIGFDNPNKIVRVEFIS